MNINRRKKLIRMNALLMAMLLLVCSGIPFSSVSSATAETVDLRFIFTTDIHGQVTSYDYQSDKEFATGGLAKAYTLMKEAISQKGKKNSFLFDLGDTMCDYTSEYIMGADGDALQPVYRAMKYIDYDAIVLGNHEFDYGRNYYKEQIEQAGLSDKVVLANVVDSYTGKNIYDGTKILKRTLKTSKGNNVTIEVGVIGVTVPALSAKTESFTGILEAKDIEDTVRYESEQLKKKGVDLVLVLAHSGIGSKNSIPFAKDASYQLTKIPNVDVVLCGHSHTTFPSDSSESKVYYELPGVSQKTNLMNGKVLVSIKEKGQEIGIADITLKVGQSGLSIAKQSGKICPVKKSTEENAKIKSFMGTWDEVFRENNQISYGEIENEEPLNNYFGPLEDNALLQMVNDSKIAFVQEWVNNTKTEYKGLPIVASSYFSNYGSSAEDNTVSLTGTLSYPMLTDFIVYKTSASIYKINGAMLKEWLEWSASAFETAGTVSKWTDEDMQIMMELTEAQPLLREDWLHEWRNFYIFDGVEYVIDISKEPRYDIDGNRINSSNRIASVTINGKPLNDTQEILLCTNRITENQEKTPIDGIRDRAVKNDYVIGQSLLESYITDLGKNGKINIEADNNWHIQAPEGNRFILKAPTVARNVAMKRNWYHDRIDSMEGFDYYNITIPTIQKDVTGPALVVSSANRTETNRRVQILVQATDSSGISVIRYSNSSWSGGSSIISDGFSVAQNGTYTVTARDKAGNETERTITIDNINDHVLQAPKVDVFSNKDKAITGKAEPGATVYIMMDDETYTTKVSYDGEFSYPMFSPEADSKISIYVEDIRGRVSETITLKVKRKGPNQIKVNQLTNTSDVIIGDARDTDSSLFVYIDDEVYVEEDGGEEAYRNSRKYDKTKTVIPTTVTKKKGKFRFHIPCQNSNKWVKIMGVDHVGRVSRVTSFKTIEEGPNPPSIYPTLSGTNRICGYVKNNRKQPLDLMVKTGGQSYRSIIGIDGYYDVKLPFSVGSDDDIEVYVTDMVDGVQRQSYIQRAQVEDMGTYITNYLESFVAWDAANDKQSDLSGVSSTSTNAYIYYQDQVYPINEKEFVIDTGCSLEPYTEAYAVCWTERGKLRKGSILKIEKALAAQPVLLEEEIANNMTSVSIWTDEVCTINVKMASMIYSSAECVYNEKMDGYIYKVKIDRTNSGTPVKIYATNSAGESPSTRTTVSELAPDAPLVNEVTNKSKYVKGMLSIVDIQQEDELEAIDTSHTVVVKTGGKYYEAVVKNDGSFKVEIPKQNANKTMKVFGNNYYGNGPATTIKVVKKQNKKGK